MVIQRWQSVLLLLATISAVLCAALPIQYVDAVPVRALQCMPLFILAVLVALLFFISIFLYKNFPLQKRTVAVSCMLTVAAGIVAAIASLWIAEAYLAAALVLALFAYGRIRHDENLLRSYDRLR